jgi:hypothetical protein
MTDEELLAALDRLVIEDLDWVFDTTTKIMRSCETLGCRTALKVALICGEDLDTQS